MRTLLVMTIALLLAVSFAQATVIAVHDGGTPVASLPGYTGYVVSLVSDTADDPAGFTGGMDGPMNHVLLMGSFPTPTLTFAGMLPDPTQDSHFLLLDADILATVAPNESAVYLGGAFSIAVAARSNPLPLALVVIADGGSVLLTGTAGDALAAELFPVDLNIPEPLTLTLLGVGGLALIRRRR